MTRTEYLRRLAAGLGSAALLVALVVIPPLMLATLVGWPLPTTIPSLHEISTALTIGVQDAVVIKAVALVCWAAWAYVAVTIAVEVVATTRGRVARALPVVPRLQASIGRLVATATLSVTTLGSAFTTPAVASVGTPIAAEQVVDPPDLRLVARLNLASSIPTQPEPTVEPTVAAPEPEPAAPQPGRRTVQVGRHDSYWAIAERTFGDGLRWQEIRDLNVGHVMPDGHTIAADSTLLRPGWTLELPAANGTDPSPASEQVTPSNGNGQADDGGDVVVVQQGDSLWSVAETHLGDLLHRPPRVAEVGPYWQRVVDQNRTRLLDPGNPHLLHAGQEIVLPPTTSAQAAPPASAPPRPSPDLGSTSPPTPDDPTPPVTENANDDAVPPSPAPTTPAHGASTAVPDNGRPTPEDRQPAPQPAADHDEAAPKPLVALIGGAGAISLALAVGATRAIRRKRRRQAFRDHHRTPTRTEDPTGLHGTLLRRADTDAYTWLCRMLDDLATKLATRGDACRPLVIQHGHDHVDVLLDQPTRPAVEGWQTQTDQGEIWSRQIEAADPDTDELALSDEATPAPLLVTLGRPDDGGQLYVDLEAAGVVCLTGDLETARGVLRSVAVELSTSPMLEADFGTVRIIGDIGGAPAQDLDHVSVHETWSFAVRDTIAWAEQTRDAMHTHDWPNSFVARGHHEQQDALSPVAVLADHEPDDATVVEKLLADQRRSVGLVMIGDPTDGALVVECAPDQLRIPQLGLVCTPHPLTLDTVEVLVDFVADVEHTIESPTTDHDVDQDDDVSDLPESDDQEDAVPAELLDDLEHVDTSEVPCDSPPDDRVDLQEPSAAVPSADVATSNDDPAVIVKVLGDIMVDGTKKPLSPKQSAVLTYIALHDSVTAEKMESAVWATAERNHRKRLQNTISETRSIVGADRLPLAENGRYTLGPAVVTDTALFEQYVQAAANQQPADAINTLTAALHLITGPIFSYRFADAAAFTWVDVENWVTTWEAKITGVAQHLVQLCLDENEPRQAIAVAEHALRVVPVHTALTESLMRAHAAQGDLRAVKKVYESHIRALDNLDLDDPAPSTMDLYHELRRRGAA